MFQPSKKIHERKKDLGREKKIVDQHFNMLSLKLFAIHIIRMVNLWHITNVSHPYATNWFLYKIKNNICKCHQKKKYFMLRLSYSQPLCIHSTNISHCWLVINFFFEIFHYRKSNNRPVLNRKWNIVCIKCH